MNDRGLLNSIKILENANNDFYRNCFEIYFLSNRRMVTINWWESPTHEPIKKNDILKYACKYIVENKKECIKKINQTNKFIATEDKNGIITIKLKESGRIITRTISNTDYYDYKSRTINNNIRKTVENFLDGIDIENLTETKKTSLRTLAKSYYDSHLKYESPNNKYRKLYEKLYGNKVHERERNILNFNLSKKLYEIFVQNYPLDEKSKISNETLKKILLNKAENLLTIEEIMNKINEYSKRITDEIQLKQYNEALKKFQDPDYDKLKYSYELFVGLGYDIKRLEKGYKNINPQEIKENAEIYKKRYLSLKEKNHFDKQKKDANNVNRTKDVNINDDYIFIFKKISDLLNFTQVVDYLEKNNVSPNDLIINFHKFKKMKDGKYSSFVLNDLEEKINYYVERMTKIKKSKKIIENVIDDIITNPNKTKREYFLNMSLEEIKEIEDDVNKYFPKLYFRYVEKMKKLEKNEINGVIQKINFCIEHGNEFSIFDFASLTNYDIALFIEKYAEFYPDEEDNIQKIMNLPFCKILSSNHYISEEKYLTSKQSIVIENDLYLLNLEDKKNTLNMLKRYNLPITIESLKEGMKKIFQMKKSKQK